MSTPHEAVQQLRAADQRHQGRAHTPETGEVTAERLAAAELGIEEAHDRCAATRPRYLPGVHAAVLPAAPCGCACHLTEAAR